MSRLKQWLYERYLPAYFYSELSDDNERLQKKVSEQAREIERLNAYIDGLLDAMARQSRIIIRGREAEK